MTTELFFWHLAVALASFLLVNWIGRHSRDEGYLPLSPTLSADQAPALNFGIRVFLPPVFWTLVATALFETGLDAWTRGFVWLAVTYVSFRLAFNVAMGRHRLLNWPKEAFYAASIIGVTWALDALVIQPKVNVLPSPDDLTTEFWVLLAFFLYQVANRIQLSNRGTRGRKQKYLGAAYRNLQRRYGSLVDHELPPGRLRSLAFAVMIYESFNRPFLVRRLESPLFLLGFAKTLGIMQVRTETRISDRESVILGCRHIAEAARQYCQGSDLSTQHPPSRIVRELDRAVISAYNGGYEYRQQVGEILAGLIADHGAPAGGTADLVATSLSETEVGLAGVAIAWGLGMLKAHGSSGYIGEDRSTVINVDLARERFRQNPSTATACTLAHSLLATATADLYQTDEARTVGDDLALDAVLVLEELAAEGPTQPGIYFGLAYGLFLGHPEPEMRPRWAQDLLRRALEHYRQLLGNPLYSYSFEALLHLHLASAAQLLDDEAAAREEGAETQRIITSLAHFDEAHYGALLNETDVGLEAPSPVSDIKGVEPPL